MSVSGFSHRDAEDLNSHMESTRSNIEEEANITRQTIAEMNTDGLQGAAAEASDALSSEVQLTLNNVNGIINRFQNETASYGEQFGGSDARFAGQIGGA